LPIDSTRLPEASYTVELELIHRAREIVTHHQLVETRVIPSQPLSERLGRTVFLKCECEQRTGSFKVRGALVCLASLQGEDRNRGVVAASAGNHGLGVAWACRVLGIPGLVVVPEGVARIKLERLREMMIKVRLHGEGYDQAEAYARELAREAEATFISPFDDPLVIAGNGGTVGLEIIEQIPDCSAVVTPVGGGGLASGLAIAAGSRMKVVGVNTEASPAMARSLSEGRVLHTYAAAPTLADGLAGGVCDNSTALCGRHLHSMEVVTEKSIAEAIRLVVRTHGLVIEGSAAVGVAAILEGKPIPGDGPVCVVLSGRNIDRDRLKQVLLLQ
jgi:threonine dehydratase